MKKLIFLLSILTLSTTVVKATLTIEINESYENAIPIAIVPFEWKALKLGNSLPVELSKIISNDMHRSGQFKPLNSREMPQINKHISSKEISTIDFSRWKQVGVDNILLGSIVETSSGVYTIEIRFIDVLRSKQVIGKSWQKVAKKQLRQAAHEISDLIYEYITGVRGAFNTRIAYVTLKKIGGRSVYKLNVADSDGANEQAILVSNEPILSPSWSPDARKLAYVSFENSRSEIFIQNLTTSKRIKIASFKGINGAPSWSPNGKNIALTLSKNGSADIYIINLKTKLLRRLTTHWAIDTESVWSPDGKYLFFNSDRRRQPQIFKVALNTGKVSRVSFKGKYNSNPDMSPDGRYVAMVHAPGGKGYRIGLLDLLTNEFVVLTNTNMDESPTFSPNGQMILYATNLLGKAKLAVTSVDGRAAETLSVSNGEVREPDWSPYIK